MIMLIPQLICCGINMEAEFMAITPGATRDKMAARRGFSVG
jgi:hypothetical protein